MWRIGGGGGGGLLSPGLQVNELIWDQGEGLLPQRASQAPGQHGPRVTVGPLSPQGLTQPFPLH